VVSPGEKKGEKEKARKYHGEYTAVGEKEGTSYERAAVSGEKEEGGGAGLDRPEIEKGEGEVKRPIG